jgi:hypothetical protein
MNQITKFENRKSQIDNGQSPDGPMAQSMGGFDLTFRGHFSMLNCFGSTAQDSRQTAQVSALVFPELLTIQKGKWSCPA